MKLFLKKIVESIPYSIGKFVAYIPFSMRLGKTYTNFVTRIKSDNALEEEKKLQETIHRFNSIFQYAKTTLPFYINLYKKAGVIDLEIKCIADIEKLPIITKSMIRNHTNTFKGAFKINTGGTSGAPFSFYIDKNAFAREWAHIHKIWALKGYKYTDLKITLRGKNLGNKNYSYNPVHNEFIINTYKSPKYFKKELLKLLEKRNIKYIHGYPSAIFNFLKELEMALSEKEIAFAKSKLKVCFLGSEFPTPSIKKYLTTVWDLDFIAWYGHSEMCILAYEANKDNKYTPFYTYGYAEVVEDRLIGTSYFNTDMPLIRYDTGDIVGVETCKNGLIKNFSIRQGREGEFIKDLNGLKIPLTALIFGRHHKAFDLVDFVQVKQEVISGDIIFYLSTRKKINKKELSTLLDLENVAINYRIELIPTPFKTKAGKVILKID